MFLVFKVKNVEETTRVNINHLVSYKRTEEDPNKSIITITGQLGTSPRQLIVDHTVEEIDKVIKDKGASIIKVIE